MRLLLALLCCTALPAQAATVFKCVDASGKVTFTQQQCPDGKVLADLVRAHNAAPSGSSTPSTMAPEPGSRRDLLRQEFKQLADDMRAPRPTSGGVTVVGGSVAPPPCSTGLSDRDLRTAKVRGEVVPGMTRKDVESMYGKPNNDGAQGAGSSTYWKDKYLAVTHVSYDSNGCARSSYQSGHKP